MFDFFRRFASRLSEQEPDDERSDRMLRGPLVCKLMTDLNNLDNITSVLAGRDAEPSPEELPARQLETVSRVERVGLA
jgi:hypothetical protein